MNKFTQKVSDDGVVYLEFRIFHQYVCHLLDVLSEPGVFPVDLSDYPVVSHNGIYKDMRTHIRTFEGFTVGEERKGAEGAIRVTDHGMVLSEEFPEELVNAHDSAVNYWEETQDYLQLGKVPINKDEILHTTQEYVSGTFIKGMSDEIYTQGDVIIGVDAEGKKWVLDGHHRLVYDRMSGRDTNVYLLEKESLRFINEMIYGEGDDDI